MEEALISFETAKLAKEKGFGKTLDTIFPYCYKIISLTEYVKELNSQNNTISNRISAPTQSIIQKWLRLKHLVDIVIDVVDNSREGYYTLEVLKSDIRDFNDIDCFDSVSRNIVKGKFESYESALEKGIQEGLKLIKN